MRDMQNDLVLYNRYSSSKLANLLYTAELARRYPNLTAISIHPGIVKTGMILNASRLDKVFIKIWRTWNRFPLVEPHEGAHTQLWAATVNKEKLVTGGYYEPGGVLGQHTKLSSDAKLAGELWDWTEKELQLQGYPASG
ncbi:hypothetical protein K438DRAFT_1810097 [Mycena galopus ATCC 62051]|nr:hypothetical protein K438DRAFT_1810097 [Mycena galopus ATCC 62051]